MNKELLFLVQEKYITYLAASMGSVIKGLPQGFVGVHGL